MKTRVPLYAHSLGAELVPPCPRNIPTNGFPHSLCYALDSIWVTTSGYNATLPGNAMVERYDAATGARLARIDVGPYQLAANVYANAPAGICEGGGFIWAANQPAGEVLKIDPATNTLVARIKVGTVTRHVCWDGLSVWATVGDSPGSIVAIDPATNEVMATVAVGAKPFRLCFDGTYLWVGCFDANAVHKVDPVPASVVQVVTTGINKPWAQCFNGSTLFVTNYGTGDVALIDPEAGTYHGSWSLPQGAGAGPHDMVIVGNELWVTLASIAKVHCIDTLTGSPIRTIAVNDDPAGMCFDGGSVWHTCAMADLILRHPVRDPF
jgi:YVTN family beta-propeller protein